MSYCYSLEGEYNINEITTKKKINRVTKSSSERTQWNKELYCPVEPQSPY